MRIVITAPEAVPYVKVGGLGDVTGILPKILTRLGHQVILVLPKYLDIDYSRHGFFPFLDRLGVNVGTRTEWSKVHLHQDEMGYQVFLIEHHHYFSRPGIYDCPGHSVFDKGERYAFFCQAVLQLCRDIGFHADAIHCHDWPTALIPALLKLQCGSDRVLSQTGSVLTIHNLAHQGKLPAGIFSSLGLPPSSWNQREFEDYGEINFLKGGIAWADLLSTVSPTYAREILTDVGGAGLHKWLGLRAADLHGILNGCDYDNWNPETDKLLPARYSAKDLSGKALCKQALQKEFGLRLDPEAPVCGVVARLSSQKGIDLIMAGVDSLISQGGQFVLLGEGEPHYGDTFRWLTRRHPGAAGTWVGFDNRRAHLIEAGADIFLMPSIFEPCGLNQMYSLRYGTVPVVRATGGLEDTVVDYDPVTHQGTGFKFHEISAEAFLGAVSRAMVLYRHKPKQFRAIQLQGMAERFTWEKSVEQSVQLYEWAVAKRKIWR